MQQERKSIGYWRAAAIGVTGMMGGGIFAVLGLGLRLAHAGTAAAFGMGGLVALITAYSYARLSAAKPSEGGTVVFLAWAFGQRSLTSSLNTLLWLSHVVMIALYAYAFGSYGAAFLPTTLQPIWKHVLISTVIIGVTGLNMLYSGWVKRAEHWITAGEIAILILFIGFGLERLTPARIAPSSWGSPLQLAIGGIIVFLAYQGFELIANVAGDMKNPRSLLPLAFFSAVVTVMVLYCLVAVVTAGNLSLDAITASRDYVLAEAAAPFLGAAGFSLIVVTALLSTLSAINATVYGAARVSYAVAKNGKLPQQLASTVWNEPLEGLLITTGVALVLANALELSSIAIMGSAGFLLIFAAVNAANFLLYKATESSRWISAFGAGACGAALTALVWYTLHHSPQKLVLLALVFSLAILIQVAYRSWTGQDLDEGCASSLPDRPRSSRGHRSDDDWLLQPPRLQGRRSVSHPHASRRLMMRINLNNSDQFTLANVRQLIASGDVKQPTQLTVSSTGWVDLAPADERPGLDQVAFQFDVWMPREHRVGAVAAGDDQWILQVYRLLKENWPHPSSRLIAVK